MRRCILAPSHSMANRIRSHLPQVAKWRDVAQQQSSQLQELQTMAQGMGQERSVNAATISRLQSELCTCQEQRSAVQEELSQLRSLHDSSAADTQQQLHELREANATMAEERARVASVREATASKLLEVRTRLGLSEAEARHFLQELDLARSKAEELRRERDRMAADQQARSEQARSRSQHCLVLIEDNKRLMGTVAALRSQVSGATLRRGLLLHGGACIPYACAAGHDP